jgi:hypothetical protein
MAAYSLPVGIKPKKVPPGTGTYREILAKSRLAAQG